MEREIPRDQKLDMAKLALRFMDKCWILLVACVAGAVVGALVYTLQYQIANGPQYQAVSKVYLDFAADETGEVYQYYNGYTWNDLMSTEPILSVTMKELAGTDISAEQVEAATKAEILSDIRLLTITITTSDAQTCKQIQRATEQSLEMLGSSAKEFRSVKVVKSTDAQRVMTDKRTKQAVLVGALLAFFIALIVLSLKLTLEDTIYVFTDLKGVVAAPLLGVELADTNGEDALSKRLAEDLSKNRSYVCPEGANCLELDVAAVTDGGEMIDYESLRAADYILVKVPCGKVTLHTLCYLLDQLSMQDCNKVGLILTQADAGWYRRYFRWGTKG